jgi:hypothetical protein
MQAVYDMIIFVAGNAAVSGWNNDVPLQGRQFARASVGRR